MSGVGYQVSDVSSQRSAVRVSIELWVPAAGLGESGGAGFGAGADAVSAGAFAAEEAAREARIVAAKDAHEIDVECADRAVALGCLREGTGIFVDEVLAIGLADVDEAALLFHDAGGFLHALRRRLALDAIAVGRSQTLGDVVQEVVQLLITIGGTDLLQQDAGEDVVSLGEECDRW